MRSSNNGSFSSDGDEFQTIPWTDVPPSQVASHSFNYALATAHRQSSFGEFSPRRYSDSVCEQAAYTPSSGDHKTSVRMDENVEGPIGGVARMGILCQQLVDSSMEGTKLGIKLKKFVEDDIKKNDVVGLEKFINELDKHAEGGLSEDQKDKIEEVLQPSYDKFKQQAEKSQATSKPVKFVKALGNFALGAAGFFTALAGAATLFAGKILKWGTLTIANHIPLLSYKSGETRKNLVEGLGESMMIAGAAAMASSVGAPLVEASSKINKLMQEDPAIKKAMEKMNKALKDDRSLTTDSPSASAASSRRSSTDSQKGGHGFSV
jgi:hypothetical protein